MFTENDTNKERLWGVANDTPYVKDAFHDYVIHRDKTPVNPRQVGTKAAAYYALTVGAGESITVQLRLSDQFTTQPFDQFDPVFEDRRREADEFYAEIQRDGLGADERNV